MNTSILEQNLKKSIIFSNTPIPECSLDEGIRFFFPAPNHYMNGAVFIGTPIQWRILQQNKQILDGCTYLICTENDADAHNIHMPITCNVFVIKATIYSLMQKMNYLIEATNVSTKHDYYDEYIEFWNNVMNNEYKNYDDIMQIMNLFPHKIKDNVACIVVRHESYLPSEFSTSQIEETLSEFFYDTNLFYYKNEWIIIYSQDGSATDTLNFSYDAFSQLLEHLHLNAGISYASHWANLLHTLYKTATASIDIGTNLNVLPKYKRIYTYYQYNPYYIVHMSYRKFTELHGTSVIYLTHPDVFYLWNSEPELFEVLYAYLSHGQSISETSRALYMHRNTVCNKLKKIEAALSHSINDPEYQLLLLLSCMLIKFHSEYI